MTPAERQIRARIADSGAISFAEFMRIALYHSGGYYPNRKPIGAGGDYFTSPVAHPAFGALICVQLRQMWRTLGCPASFWAIECGAGDGALANDIIAYAQRQFPNFAPALRYISIDRAPNVAASVYRTPSSWTPPHPQPSSRPQSSFPRRRESRALVTRQPQFPERAHSALEYIQSNTIPLRDATGCILSNELLDAFPVHRFEMAGGRPREILVTIDADGNFAERLSEPTTPLISQRIATAGRALPDGFRGEVNPSIGAWVASASAALKRGYVLTIDYGYEAGELYSDARRRGTLQTYYRHTDASSPYQRIGRQDMTAHADFTALIESGRDAGLRPVFLTTQADFLRSLGIERMASAIRDSDMNRMDKTANLRDMSRLIDPDGLGNFRVLVQHKNAPITHSTDLIPPPNTITHLRPPTPPAPRLPNPSFHT